MSIIHIVVVLRPKLYPLCHIYSDGAGITVAHILKELSIIGYRSDFAPVMLCACVSSSVCSVGLGLGVTLHKFKPK